jgi:exonuclease III
MSLQETGSKTYKEIIGRGGKIINLGGITKEYRGLGFYIRESWLERLISVRLINDRIAVIKFDMGEKGKLTVINVYGPTLMVTRENPEKGRDFYAQLSATYNSEKEDAALVFITGDFNSKIGMQVSRTDSEFMGKYGKGVRNDNGNNLKNLLVEEGLYLINTHFKLRHTQIATWHGGRPAEGKTTPGCHNQIDYIVVPKRAVKLVADARAYTGLRHRSDHAMVVMKISLGDLCKMRRIKCSGFVKRDNTVLAENPEVRAQYEACVENKLGAWGAEEPVIGAEELYQKLKKAVKEAADEVLPAVPHHKNGAFKYLSDPVLSELSKEQRKLSRRIYHPGRRNAAKIRELRKYRSAIYVEIKLRIKTLDEGRAEDLANRLMESKGNRQFFEIQRYMSKKTRQQLRLQDSKGNEYLDPARMVKPLQEYYEEFFTRAGDQPLLEWRGEARALLKPITVEEVGIAAGKLKNGRATGPDEMAGEQLKYGGARLWREIETILNKIFEKHESISELKSGYLYPLNKKDKPGKFKTADMTRPLIFLAVLRKVLSLIVLSRIIDKVEEYLSMGQHAYRVGRSTTEVVWTMQWLIATAEKFKERIHVTSLDMSKAFDNLDRWTLMEVLERNGLANEDELRIIFFLLSETSLRVKVGANLGEMFKTFIGTPQGDALSPILFLIYLEDVLRRHRGHNLLSDNEYELIFADDVTFVTKDGDNGRGPRHAGEEAYQYHEGCQCAACRGKLIELTIPGDMAESKMICNGDKTEHYEFVYKSARGTAQKVLGNNLNPALELQMRRDNAATAFAGLYRIWLRKSDISIAVKLKLWRAVVRPHFLYNAAATTYLTKEVDSLDSLQRRQLRIVLGVRYPAHMSNEEVYRRSEELPISQQIVEARWTFLGHLLRRERHRPANLVTAKYFISKEHHGQEARDASNRSRLLTTIPRILQKDLANMDLAECKDAFAIIKLTTTSDLATLRNKAQSRGNWRRGVEKIVAAAATGRRSRENYRQVRQANVAAMRGPERAATANTRAVVRRQSTINEYFGRA